MEAFPTIRQMFNDLNTGLAANATVENLFALGGRIFATLRTPYEQSSLRDDYVLAFIKEILIEPG
jgi:hypothetical protein